MSKKILYLRTDICNQELIAGGSVTHTVGVIQGFIALGYSVVCASSCMLSVLQTAPLAALKPLKNPRILSWLRWKLNCLLSNIFFTIQTLVLLRDQHIDFIYQRYSILNMTGVLVSAIKKVPLLLEYNGSEAWIIKHWGAQRWFTLAWLIEYSEMINLRYADFIIVVSAALKDELIIRGIDERKILINPNGVQTEVYDPIKLESARRVLRKNLNIDKKFVFGFIGTFSQWHGIEILSAMIPEVLARVPNAHFLLIGDGPLLSMIKDTCKKNTQLINAVTFTGLVPHEQAREYLAACDAFLSPTQPNQDGTRFFGSPTKLFEYMSLGKPIIASDLEQLAEILHPAISIDDISDVHLLDKNSVGILVKPAYLDGFIKAACMTARSDQTILNIIGHNVRSKAVADYSWTNHVSKIITFIS